MANLLGTTGRQRSVAALVVVLGLAVAILMMARQWSLVAAVIGLLLAGAVLVLLDLRRRTGDLQRRLARQANATRSLLRAVGTIAAGLQQLTSDVSALEKALTDLRGRHADERRRHAALLHQSVGLATRQPQEVEALLQLYSKVSPRAPMPPSGRWALNPTGLLNLYSLVEKHRPALIVELGSGTSTVWLGYAIVQQGHGRVVSLDHLAEYAEHTRTATELHGLNSISEVRVAALTDTKVGDDIFKWYDLSAFADLDQIDLLFVDGPPGGTGHDARYPAVPMLLDRLANGALVVLDDIDRADEQEIVERWLKHTPGLTREEAVVGDQAVLRYCLAPQARAGHR